MYVDVGLIHEFVVQSFLCKLLNTTMFELGGSDLWGLGKPHKCKGVPYAGSGHMKTESPTMLK